MFELLPLTRELLIPTQTGVNVLRKTPLGLSLGFELAPISELELDVSGGDVFSERQGINYVTATIQYDDRGRPIEELVVNEDRDEPETTTRRWQYTSGDATNYRSWLEGQDDEDLVSSEVIDESNIRIVRHGKEYIVHRYVGKRGDGYLLHDAIEPDEIFEDVIYDNKGSILRSMLSKAKNGEDVYTIYRRDQNGQVIEGITYPGGITSNGVNVPNSLRIDRLESGLIVVRKFMGLDLLRETIEITLNEQGQPVVIKRVSGIDGLGRTVTNMKVLYRPESSTPTSQS